MPEPRQRRRGRRVRLRRNEAIAAGSAIALLVLLFVPWYDVSYSTGRLIRLTGLDRTPWETLDVIAPLLALLSVLTLALVAARLLKPGWKPAIVPGAAIAVLGAAATVLVLCRVVFPPEIEGLVGVDLEVTPNLGAFLGLAAALGVAIGGYRSMRAAGSSFGAVAESLRAESRQREDREREGKDPGRPPERAN